MKIIWNRSIIFLLLVFYIITTIIGFVIFGSNSSSLEWFLVNFTIISFFGLGSYVFYASSIKQSESIFICKLFFGCLLIKIAIVFANYYIFDLVNGIPFHMHSDSYGYHLAGQTIARSFSQGNFNVFNILSNEAISDIGAKTYYGIIYYVLGDIGNNIIVARIVNATFSSLAVTYFYKTIRFINKPDIARTSAILYMFYPLFNLYAGTHYKESFLLFLIAIASFYSYQIFFRNKYKPMALVWLTLSIFVSFFFRNVLAIVLILSVVGFFFFSFRRINIVRSIISFFIITLVLLISYKTMFQAETERFSKRAAQYSNLVVTMVENSRRVQFYFANFYNFPIMVISTLPAPLPTITNYKSIRKDHYFGLLTLTSSSFIKNLLSFWALLGIIYLTKNKFKENSFLLLYFFGYYLIIVISGYSFIIRFLAPIIPLFLYFAVLGLRNYYKYSLLFVLFLIIMVATIIYYNLTKLLDYGLLIL